MKNLILITLFCLFIISSCKKDDPVPATTYYLKNSTEVLNTGIKYLDGTLWQVTVYCFDVSGDVVREDNFTSVPSGGGETIKTEATDNIVKIVVSFMMVPRESEYYNLETNYRRYTKTKFALVPHTENKIEITGETTVSGSFSKLSENVLIKNIQYEFELK